MDCDDGRQCLLHGALASGSGGVEFDKCLIYIRPHGRFSAIIKKLLRN
jgi:hypothetical protein